MINSLAQREAFKTYVARAKKLHANNPDWSKKQIKKEERESLIKTLIDNHKPKFPPDINVENFYDTFKLSLKPPNAFIIYRWVLNKELKIHKLNISQLSSLSSKLWRKEPAKVKKYYVDLVREVQKKYKKPYLCILHYRGPTETTRYF